MERDGCLLLPILLQHRILPLAAGFREDNDPQFSARCGPALAPGLFHCLCTSPDLSLLFSFSARHLKTSSSTMFDNSATKLANVQKGGFRYNAPMVQVALLGFIIFWFVTCNLFDCCRADNVHAVRSECSRQSPRWVLVVHRISRQSILQTPFYLHALQSVVSSPVLP